MNILRLKENCLKMNVEQGKSISQNIHEVIFGGMVKNYLET